MRRAFRYFKVIVVILATGYGALTLVNDLTSEWSRIGRTDEYVVWINKKSIVRDGDQAKAWLMYNYSTPQTETDFSSPYRSAKYLWLFRCSDRHMSLSSAIYYQDQKAAGEIVGRDDYESENFVGPSEDTVGGMALTKACGSETAK